MPRLLPEPGIEKEYGAGTELSILIKTKMPSSKKKSARIRKPSYNIAASWRVKDAVGYSFSFITDYGASFVDWQNAGLTVSINVRNVV